MRTNDIIPDIYSLIWLFKASENGTSCDVDTITSMLLDYDIKMTSMLFEVWVQALAKNQRIEEVSKNMIFFQKVILNLFKASNLMVKISQSGIKFNRALYERLVTTILLGMADLQLSSQNVLSFFETVGEPEEITNPEIFMCIIEMYVCCNIKFLFLLSLVFFFFFIC